MLFKAEQKWPRHVVIKSKIPSLETLLSYTNTPVLIDAVCTIHLATCASHTPSTRGI